MAATVSLPLNLTINFSTGTDSQVHCNSYTWIDGNTYTLSTNTATYALTNAAGCDSIVTLELTITNNSFGIDTQSHCGFYTWIDGNIYVTNNNTATWTLQNSVGCDSIVTLNLAINNSSTGTDIQKHCVPYTWIDGITYTHDNNSSTWVLQNAAGCDSIITLDLAITNLNSLVSVNGITLSSGQPGAQYQWINCDTQQHVIDAQGQSFTPTVNGKYAVIV
ncbi:MAG: hypothetical protein H0X62_10965, partial [Bacteroidetes bacterium]|nr:hypothetical protein [Bacteroidota bacterium]